MKRNIFLKTRDVTWAISGSMGIFTRNLSFLIALVILAFVSSAITSQAQFPQGSYTNIFDTGGNTEPFAGSGSVASWLYWYNLPGNNTPITNDVTTLDPNAGPTAGSLRIDTPFDGTGNQDVFFGTFGNQYGYDFTTEVDMNNFSEISFDILVASNQVPDGSGNFGTIGVGIINANYGYQEFGRPTIPGSASNGWVHISVPIDHTQNNLANVPGIAFDYNSYSGYPTSPFTFWIGNLVMTYSGAKPPPPTGALEKIVPGLTQFADQKPSYNRQDIRTDTSGT
ncbi:MAG TPA: hypothetical protein VFM25_05320, partial [Verrucomicrobiae bacterium]|nr:hypothetical protein [Verrucomicrobiae bacterium]